VKYLLLKKNFVEAHLNYVKQLIGVSYLGIGAGYDDASLN
jgi:hypothetical protein